MISPINSQQKLHLAQQRVEILAHRKDELLLNPDVLAIVLEELAITLEEIQVQYETLVGNQERLEQERLYYQNLFELVSESYLITNDQGIIQEANQGAINLLNLRREFLLGKPLILFIAEGDRRKFSTEMISLGQLKHWHLKIKPRQSDPIAVLVTTNPIYDLTGNIVSFAWSFRAADDLIAATSEKT